MKENKQVTDDHVVSDFIRRIFQEAGVEDGRLPDDCLDVKGDIERRLSDYDRFNFKMVPNRENNRTMNETLLIEFMKFQKDIPVPSGIMATTNPYYSIELKGIEQPVVIRTSKLRKLMHDNFAGFETTKDKKVICYVIKVPRQLLLDNAE